MVQKCPLFANSHKIKNVNSQKSQSLVNIVCELVVSTEPFYSENPGKITITDSVTFNFSITKPNRAAPLPLHSTWIKGVINLAQ